MNALRLSVPSLVLILLLAGCSDEENTAGGSFSIQTLPSGVGTLWTYDRLMVPENIRNQNPNEPFLPDTVQSTFTVNVTKIVLLTDPGDSVTETREFLKTETELRPWTSTYRSYAYYSVTDSGWYLHGTGNGGGSIVPPMMRQTGATFTFGGRTFCSIAELLGAYGVFAAPIGSDSIIRQVPPLLEFPLPLSAPRQWTYRRGSMIGKEAVRDTIIGVAGMSLRCVVIRWRVDWDGDSVPDSASEFLDYVSSLGIVRRTFFFKDVIVTSSSGPEIVAIVDIRDTITLTAIAMP